jgi:hypothetical protein
MTRLPQTSTERTREIVRQIARQCDVTPDMLEDAYPCTAFVADLYKAGTQVAGILHYNLVFRLRDTTPQLVDRICKAFESVHYHNPILRSRVVKYTDRKNGTPRLAQALVKEDFAWLEFANLNEYCHERTGHCLRYGQRLVHYGISRDKKYLVWSLYHAAYDGWFMGILWKELCNAMSAEGDLTTSTQGPKYVKFVAHLQKPMAEVDKKYWAEHLANYTGARLKQYNSVPETDARRHGSLKLLDISQSSINTTARIQAAWLCVLVELYGNLDVMTSTVTTGRNSQVEGITDMRGPCLCMVPFRQRIDLTVPLYKFIMDVERRSGELLTHEHAGMESLESLVDEAQRPNHTFNLKSGLGGDFTGFPGLEFQPVQDFKKRTDWLVAVSIGEEALRWDLFFDSNRLDQGAIDLICERFPVLLQTCQTLESHEDVTLEDVVDLRRLRCDL